MATKKKLLQAAAGSAGGAALNVEDVFSTYLRTSDGTTATVTNSIDLSTEGGLVWTKSRSNAFWHVWYDTERGGSYSLTSNNTNAQANNVAGAVTFNTDGYSIASGYGENNASGYTYVDWTFRKAPKFFDVVTYTGDGTSNRQISHDLGTTAGMCIVKRTDSSASWFVWHRSTGDNVNFELNDTTAASTVSNYLVTASSTTFTVGNNADVNANGGTYVAYLFAHDPMEGFAEDVQEYYANGSNISGFNGTGEYRIYTNSTNNNTAYNAGGDQGSVSGVDNFSGIVAKIETDTGQKVRVGPQQAVSGAVTFYSIITQNEPTEPSENGLIVCGSYIGTGSNGNSISLGFEPQWVLVKKTNEAYDWTIFDNMRGVVNGGNDQFLHPNLTDAEDSPTNAIQFDANGFTVNGGFAWTNDDNDTYIYIAIRRGPMAVPESATDVFHVRQGSATADQFFSTGFDPDLLYSRDATNAASNNFFGARLTGQRDGAQNLMWTNATTAETATSGRGYFGAKSKGYYFDDTRSESMNMAWGRAPNYFDVVAYTGDGTSNRAIEHNLGVAPEMIWVKARNISYDWVVKHKDLGRDELTLNATTAAGGNLGADFWGTGTDTSTVFHTANSGTNRNTNGNNDTYIAYLFASLAGISKVGSYTGNGTNQTINCGFSAGARFILIKRTDSTGPWYIWDTERGIISGNDPYLRLNLSSAEVTTNDSIDPDNSGFIVNQVTATNINVSSATYIFYAVS